MDQIDVVIEILLRLPVKSILRFKLVCKSWCSLINSALFIDMHFRKSNTSNCYILVNRLKVVNESDYYPATRILSYETLGYVDVRSFSPSYPLRIDNNDSTKSDFTRVWIKGCCNGLILVEYDDDHHHFALWNLATGETKVIPTCLCARGQLGSGDVLFQTVGFGFDAQGNDYKVVMINKLNDTAHHRIVVEVYSLRTHSWKTVAIPSNPSTIVSFKETRQLVNGNGVFSNGMYSWVANVKAVRGEDSEAWYEIFSFDMSKEVITITPLPSCIRDCSMYINSPLVFNGFFALSNSVSSNYVGLKNFEYFDIWVLGEYGVEESWTLVFTLGPFDIIKRVLGFWKDNKVLAASAYGHPFLYDPVTEFSTSLDTPGQDTKLFFYKESLVRLTDEDHYSD